MQKGNWEPQSVREHKPYTSVGNWDNAVTVSLPGYDCGCPLAAVALVRYEPATLPAPQRRNPAAKVRGSTLRRNENSS
jgi:hypothetical protein